MMYARPNRLAAIAAAIAAVLLAAGLVSCSPKKNTAATRNYQAFITRYNIYFNGDTHYRETLAEMEDKYEDDYSQQVLMHPVDAKSNPKAPQPSGDFTRSIEKGQKAIQLRSIKKRPKSSGPRTAKQRAWLKRDEYNPFLHNAWMMMGRGQYFNGDFLGAASTFFYISRHFSWLPKTITEAQLWQARSYVSLGWLFEAEIIINRIKPAELSTKTLRELYNFVKADYLIRSDKPAEAIEPLKLAIKDASRPQKTRLRFLLGQLYARLGRKQEAYDAFKAAGSASSAPYRTKFNARIKQSEVFTGSDITPEVNALRRMTRYDRNKEYLDQIYYAIGNLYLSRGDTTRAIENYVLAAEKSTRSGIDKAISQITLGGLYFDRRQYELAQPCYAEAVPMLPDDYPDIKTLRLRSDVLDELATYSQSVNLQDSLLRLSAMSPEQRLKVVEKIIEELKQKEKEEAEAARREEYLAERDANSSNLQDNSTQQFTLNTDNSWYFYNTATRNAGRTEFQRRWGARKLEDNWRRRNKSSFNVDDFNASPTDEDEEESGEEKPLFYFNACRYDNGAAIAANMGNIPVCVGEGEKMLIGRNLFIRDPRLFFSAGNKEIDARYRTVSRNNALLFVEDKKLYVELYREDGATKAAVYVNEEKLGSDEVRELQDGDRIRLGGRKTVHDGTIDLEIVSAQEKERRARNGDPESMMRVMTEMRRDLAQLQGDVTSIWEFVARINPADLVVRRGEDAEAYENRLEASVPEAAYPTREECVAGFLEAVVERDSGKYRKKMEFFQENDRRFHLLYQAAFFERACEANGLEDYAGPMSFLGKAMEGFVMGEIAEVVKTFHREAYKVLFAQKGNWINQSDILGLCRQNGGIQKILLAAGYDEKERKQLSGRVNNALNVLHDVRKARNATSHCDPDTERPSDSKVDAITRQGYEKIKKKLLSSDAVEVMHDLYLRAKQRKDPA